MRARLLVIAAALLAYGSILWNGAGLSMPDDLLAMHAPLNGPRPFYVFVNHVFGSSMFVNLALHAVCALLVYEIMLHIIKGYWLPATLAGVFFASHPLQADAVASVAGRSMLLCALYSLSAVLVSLRFRDGWSAIFGSIFLLMAAFACREDAITVIPVIVYVYYERGVLSRLAAIIAVPALMTYGHLLIAWHDASKIPASGIAAADVVSVYTPPAHFTLRYLEAMSQHFFPALFGIGLSAAPRIDASSLWLIVTLMLIGIVIFMFERAKMPYMRCAWLLFLAPLAAYAFMPLSDVTLEHRYYIAMAGLSIIVGIIAGLLNAQFSRRYAYGMITVIALLIAGSTVRSHTYRSMESLYADAAAKNPDDPRVRINHAMSLYVVGRHAEARGELILASGRLSLAAEDLANFEISERGPAGLAQASRYLDLVDRIPEYHP